MNQDELSFELISKETWHIQVQQKWKEAFLSGWKARIKQLMHKSYMDMQTWRNKLMGEAKHKARVNKMEREQIDIQGYAMELF